MDKNTRGCTGAFKTSYFSTWAHEFYLVLYSFYRVYHTSLCLHEINCETRFKLEFLKSISGDRKVTWLNHKDCMMELKEDNFGSAFHSMVWWEECDLWSQPDFELLSHTLKSCVTLAHYLISLNVFVCL